MKTNLIVRDACPEDVPEILELIRDLAAFELLPNAVEIDAVDLDRILFSPEPTLHAIVVDAPDQAPHKLAGVALWFLKFSTWTGRHSVFLDNINVRSDYRRHGVGSSLLSELARICVDGNHVRLEWWVLDSNQNAIDFYDRIDAHSMDEWTVQRLEGTALESLARKCT